MLNSRDINLLRWDVAENCRRWLERCRAAGLEVLVTNTVRDEEYQAYLYAQGRTRPGSIVTNSAVPTYHADHAGLAFDFCQNIRGQEYSDRAFFHSAAALAKEMGFSWGGDWQSFPDLPHLQWDSGGQWTNGQILRREYPPAMPLFEEETMTQETFNQMMETYLAQRGEESPAAWSAEARQWAEKQGIFAGDGDGAMRYRAFVTREEAAVLLQRLCCLLQS